MKNLLFVVIILTFSLVGCGLLSHRERKCDFTEEVIDRQFDVVLSSVYVDSSNHLHKIVEYEEGGKMVRSDLFLIERSNLFFELKAGDRISKKQGTLNMIVESNEKRIRHRLDFGCNDLVRPASSE